MLLSGLSLLLVSSAASVTARPGDAFPRDSFTSEVSDVLSSAGSNSSSPDSLKKLTIQAPDGSIKASYVAFGAAVQEFWVKDHKGQDLDLVVGFDNISEYATNRQYFGPIVGRYANRIRNGTYSIPPTFDTTNSTKTDSKGHPVKVYNAPTNENNGTDTLHGGYDGFDQRYWKVAKHTSSQLQLTLLDPAGMEGFPGELFTTVTYTLEKGGKYHAHIESEVLEDKSTGKRPETPVLLSSHTWWNLDGYGGPDGFDAKNPNRTGNVAGENGDHYFHIKANKVVATDGILIPTGNFTNVEGTAYDFRKPTRIGSRINETEGYCGTGCVGYDTCFIYDEAAKGQDVLSFWSTDSGIRLDVTTNQPALQVYSCDGFLVSQPEKAIPRKASQGGGKAHPEAFYGTHSCTVLEQEGYIDAINQPEWGVDQIYGGEHNRKFVWDSTYTFSNIHL